MSTKTLAIVVALAALVLGVVVSQLTSVRKAGENPPVTSSGNALGGDFTLAGAGGQVSLADFRGRVVALYFGYTYCPDACPTSLLHLGKALGQLAPAEREDVQALFVTLDPARDTPERLVEYAHYFHPTMLGLGGSEIEVAQVARRYGVYFALQRENAADRDYLVDHTSRTFVIARDGQVREILAHGTTPDEVAAALRTALAD